MTTTNTYGRQVVAPLANKSGGSVAAGDVVIVDTANNDAFTTSTAGAVTGTVGVAQETIANNATGRVLLSGYAALVNTSASVTRGNFGKTHTVVKQAVDAGASRVAGTFCQFLTGGTTPDAIVFPSDLGSGSGTGTLTTVKNEGSNLSTAAVSMDFVGGAVNATNSTTAITVTIPALGSTRQSVQRTAGNLNLTGGTTTMTEVSSALRLTIAAATGDILMIGLSGLLEAAAAGDTAIDSATIVSGAIVNQCSGGSRGAGHLMIEATGYVGGGATLTYAVVSGDISGGNVVVSPSYVHSGAGTGHLYATGVYTLNYWVMNLGH